MRPGVNVTTRDNAPPSSAPVDVGTGFLVGVTESGPQAPSSLDLVQNLDEYVARYNPTERAFTAGQSAYDAAELFYAEGGNRLYVGRVTGPAAVSATAAIGTAWVATASSPGSWGNDLTVVIRTPADDSNIQASHVRVRIANDALTEIHDESHDLATVAEGISWATTSDFVVLTAGTVNALPAAMTVPLLTGADDIAGITNAEWEEAAESLSTDLGPGILFAPGATTDALHVIMADQALARGRIYFADGANTATVSTLLTSARNNIDASGSRSRFTGLFVPWLIVAGIGGTTKVVAPSGAVAGLFCRNMAGGLSANQPAAGEKGRLRTALDLTQHWTDAERETLNLGGVNVIRDIYGVRKVYGWRTTADAINDPRWINLGNSVLHRQIVALAGVVGERFVFRQIDGQGTLFGEFAGALIGEICMPMYQGGSLYGSTPGEAFKVDTGPSINTTATIANNELRAVMSVKMSPFGEQVNIEVVKYLVTETIPA